MVWPFVLEGAHRRSSTRVSLEVSVNMRGEGKKTHMCEHLFRQSSPLSLFKRFVEAENAPATLQAIAGHFEFVHRVHVLNQHFNARSIWCFCCPEVEVLMSPRFKIKCVVAVVEISEFGKEMEIIFGIELCV